MPQPPAEPQPEDAHPKPAFLFYACSEIRESLGLRAENVPHLMERLETVPEDSIYYHTVRCLLRPGPVPAPYPDDLANWAALEVGDRVLAERLALPSPFDFPDTEAFRGHLLDVLDDHLMREPWAGRLLPAAPFYFLRGHLGAVPLDLEVRNLTGLRAALLQVDASTIYFHTVEAIGRLGRDRNDFASWAASSLELPALANRLNEIDPFVLSLEDVREQLLALIDEQLSGPVGP